MHWVISMKLQNFQADIRADFAQKFCMIWSIVSEVQ